ncbi:Uncharacterized protein Adt_45022 [Abeliophyllum distichum]|uniref:Uncharacterized protein n=1 Tax=Abeliophyllum distichum TaxID=126358 RepID=A0ABD1PD71_9LAMI
MLKKFEMEDLKPMNTPMSSSIKLDKDEQGTSVDITKYRGERLPSPSSSEEEDSQTKRFDRCPVLIGKNVDLGSFTFDAPSFHIEDLFIGMGWVGILTLDDKSLYHKTIPHIEGEYDPVAVCCRVTGKHFDAPTHLSTNQLTLTCRVLHNIIAHIIVPRKGHHDEVNHYDVFLLDSILLG